MSDEISNGSNRVEMTMSTETDYPPLTSLDAYPLHGWDYGTAYACQGGGSTYDWRCLYCVDLAWERVAQGDDPVTAWRQSGEHDERPVTLGWLVARSRYHGVKGAPETEDDDA